MSGNWGYLIKRPSGRQGIKILPGGIMASFDNPLTMITYFYCFTVHFHLSISFYQCMHFYVSKILH